MMTQTVPSPLGDILLAAEGDALTGLWFVGERLCGEGLETGRTAEEESPAVQAAERAVLAETRRWLEEYFAGREPEHMPKLRLVGSPFREEVWALLREIPYGRTVSYGELAKILAERRGIPKMSARAVGGAVGHNPISLIVPCHRVIGSDGSLTGYGSGLGRKEFLLKLEGILK